MPANFILLNMLFEANVFLLTFCLDYLSIVLSVVLKSLHFVFMFVSPFSSVNICFIYLGSPVLGE